VPKSKSFCGAETKAHGTCQVAVKTAGDRCHIHKGRPLAAKRVLVLMFKVVDKVASLGGAYAAFQLAHPAILSIWAPVRGLFMPEYFWDNGFEPKDTKRMKSEIDIARRKSRELEIRYSQYTTAQQLAVEKAYHEVLRVVEVSDLDA